MTPEELEELRALAGRLSGTAYNENLAAILGAALEHIHKQDARIAELEAQVAALKKIAEEERAAMLACAEDLHGIDEGHLIEARRQLAEEHPEAFR